uniref:G domain-containing protein n=1 Tax=Compsopogon caeruleus TaxID=31354 RepID=A0A7S1XEQ8_9RHOD
MEDEEDEMGRSLRKELGMGRMTRGGDDDEDEDEDFLDDDLMVGLEDDDDDDEFLDEDEEGDEDRDTQEDEDDEDDDEDDEDNEEIAQKSKRKKRKAKLSVGGQIIVDGPSRFLGRVCSGCGGIIGEVMDVEGNKMLMRSGSVRDLRINWRKISRTRDIHRMAICTRCQLLKKGDVASAFMALKDIDPEVFKNQLRHLSARQIIVIKVVDALDFDGTWINHLRDLIGKNPVVLAVTKADLILDMRDVEGRMRLMRWCEGRVWLKGLNCVASFAVSGKTGFGVEEMVDYFEQNLNGRNLYVVGFANAGKSTLVNRLKDEFMNRFYFKGTKGYMRKQDLEKSGVTISRLPGTTLKSIRIPCFKSHRHAMWDTPGIIVPRFSYPSLEPMRIALMKEEPVKIIPLEFTLYPDDVFVVGENLLQIEIVAKPHRYRAGPAKTKWYSNLCNDIRILSISEALMAYPRTETGDKVNRMTPRLIKEFTPERSALGKGGVDADIVIHNLGFLAVWAKYGDFTVRIYGPSPLQPTIRPCLPIPDYKAPLPQEDNLLPGSRRPRPALRARRDFDEMRDDDSDDNTWSPSWQGRSLGPGTTKSGPRRPYPRTPRRPGRFSD